MHIKHKNKPTCNTKNRDSFYRAISCHSQQIEPLVLAKRCPITLLSNTFLSFKKPLQPSLFDVCSALKLNLISHIRDNMETSAPSSTIHFVLTSAWNQHSVRTEDKKFENCYIHLSPLPTCLFKSVIHIRTPTAGEKHRMVIVIIYCVVQHGVQRTQSAPQYYLWTLGQQDSKKERKEEWKQLQNTVAIITKRSTDTQSV